jgi:hypothetical protein
MQQISLHRQVGRGALSGVCEKAGPVGRPCIFARPSCGYFAGTLFDVVNDAVGRKETEDGGLALGAELRLSATSGAKVSLEAGNSPQMIFKHLVGAVAGEWAKSGTPFRAQWLSLVSLAIRS